MNNLNSILDILNNALSLDSIAIGNLVKHRVECNEELANHPTIVVQHNENDFWPTVGFLGILNGIVKPLTGKRIAAQYDESGLLVGFIEYKEKEEKEGDK